MDPSRDDGGRLPGGISLLGRLPCCIFWPPVWTWESFGGYRILVVSRTYTIDRSLTWLVAELGDAVDIMRLIKQAIDPNDLFNPGKIFALGA